MASKGSIEAGRGHVTLGVQSDALTKGLAAAEAKFQAWGKGIMSLGAGISAAGAAITAPFLYGLSVFTSWGDEVSMAMRQTGLSFQQTENIMRGTRTTTEELVPAFAHLSQFIVQAAHGSQEAATALQTMGLSVADLLAMDPAARFDAIANSIANIGDANQRIAMQRTIFGRGGLALNLEGGQAGMNQRRERAEYLTGSPTDADRALAKETSKAFKEMGAAIQAVWREIGAAAAPVMRDFFQLVTRVVVEVRKWVTENRELLNIIFRVADAAVTVGAVIVGVGTAVYGASYAFAFLSGAIAITKGFLLALWGATIFAVTGFGIAKVATLLWTAALWLYNAAGVVAHAVTWGWVVALGAVGVALSLLPLAIVAVGLAALGIGSIFAGVVSSITGGIGTITAGFSRMFAGLTATAISAFGGIRDAFSVGDWQLVWEIVKISGLLAWEHIKDGAIEMFYGVKDTAIDVWTEVSTFFVETFESIWTKIRQIFAVGWAFIKSGWYESAAAAAEILGQTERAALNRAQARLAREEGVLESRRIGGNANRERIQREDAARAAWFDEQNLRVERDMAMAAGNQEAVDRLNQELFDQTQVAAMLAAGRVGATPGGEGGGGEGIAGGRAFSMPGSFFADAIRGWGGAAGGQTPVQVTNQLLRDQIAQTNELIREMRRIQGLGFA